MFMVTRQFDGENISRVCRTCLREDSEKMICLFIGPTESSLGTKLQSLSALKVSQGDGLPEKMCDHCVLKAESALLFREQCRAADKALRQALQSLSRDKYSYNNSSSGVYQQNYNASSYEYAQNTSTHTDSRLTSEQDYYSHGRLHSVYYPTDESSSEYTESQNSYLDLSRTGNAASGSYSNGYSISHSNNYNNGYNAYGNGYSNGYSNAYNSGYNGHDSDTDRTSNVTRANEYEAYSGYNNHRHDLASCVPQCSLCTYALTSRSQYYNPASVTHSDTTSISNEDINIEVDEVDEASSQTRRDVVYSASTNQVLEYSMENVAIGATDLECNDEYQDSIFTNNFELSHPSANDASQMNVMHSERDTPQSLSTQISVAFEEPEIPQDMSSSVAFEEPDIPQDMTVNLTLHGTQMPQNMSLNVELDDAEMPQDVASNLLLDELETPQDVSINLALEEPEMPQDMSRNVVLSSDLPQDTPLNTYTFVETSSNAVLDGSEILQDMSSQSTDSPQHAEMHTRTSPESMVVSPEPDVTYDLGPDEIAKENKYKCEICSGIFDTKLKLETHQLAHEKKKTLTCYNCGKTYATKAKLCAHMRLHTKSGIHQCKICHKIFSFPSYLNEHMQVHRIKKMNDDRIIFECHVCRKQFQVAKTYKRHMKFHTGKGLFQCNFCKKLFNQKYVLEQHVRTHKSVKTHKCDICKKTFHQKSAITEHMRTHTKIKPFKCKTCGKSFTQSSHLKNHELSHGSVRKYQCSTCNKGFKLATHLKRHMKSHEGIKDHTCNHCDRGFAEASGLKRHMKKHAHLIE